MRLNDKAGLNVCKELHELSVHWFEVRTINRDRDSVVGIATRYGLEGPAIESRSGGESFRTYLHWPWGPPSFLYNGYRIFPGGKDGRGVTLTTHPHLVPRS